MSRKAMGFLPLAPLMAATGLDRALIRRTENQSPSWTNSNGFAIEFYEGNCSQSLLAEHLGVKRRAIARWAAEGVPVSRADAAACHFGLNPVEIWGDEWWKP